MLLYHTFPSLNFPRSICHTNFSSVSQFADGFFSVLLSISLSFFVLLPDFYHFSLFSLSLSHPLYLCVYIYLYMYTYMYISRYVWNALVPGVSEITTDRCYDDWLSARLGAKQWIAREVRARGWHRGCYHRAIHGFEATRSYHPPVYNLGARGAKYRILFHGDAVVTFPFLAGCRGAVIDHRSWSTITSERYDELSGWVSELNIVVGSTFRNNPYEKIQHSHFNEVLL